MSYQLYPSDLTNREWEYINRLIPAAKPGGRKRQTDMRLTVNAIFYINRTGSQWRYLPRKYPPGQTAYGYFRAWRIAGIWERMANLFSKLRKIWADSIYNGGIAKWVKNLRRRNRLDLETVKRPEGAKGFLVLARRWVIERTFVWLSSHRRLSKGYEYLPETSEAFIRIAMIRLMLALLP